MPDPHSETEPVSPGAVSEHSSHNNEPLSPTSSKATSRKKGKKQIQEPRDTGPKFEGEYTGGLVDGEHSRWPHLFITFDAMRSQFIQTRLSVKQHPIDFFLHIPRMFLGIRHGKGSVKFPNGDTYHGDFRNGMRDGNTRANL
jgi:hypothetical protein